MSVNPVFTKVIKEEKSDVTSSLYLELTKGSGDFVQDHIKIGAEGHTLNECQEKMAWLLRVVELREQQAASLQNNQKDKGEPYE